MYIWLYGREYEAVVISLLVLIPGVVFESASTLFAQHFTGRGRAGLVVTLSGIALVVQIGRLGIMLPRWGFEGAIVGTSLAYMANGLLRFLVFAWVEGIPLAKLLAPRREDVIFLMRFGRDRLVAAWGLVPGVTR